MSFEVLPVTLEGQYLKLEPLAREHAQGLYLRGQETGDWAYMPRSCFVDLADCRHWIDEAVADPAALAFAYIERHKQRVIGSSRYLNIRPEHRSLEIGWTWLGRDFQRTPINTEAKLLLIGHAIETLGAHRVEFKTDARNQRSQAALERIGAVREGVMRKHMIVQDGYQRDSVYFSIVDDEWPAVKEKLQARLNPATR
jgi:RimJ/RimL family protein N-acetyltransferase